MSQQNGDGTWAYPNLEEAMEEAGMQDVDTYIASRQNTVVQFIVTRPIMDLYLAAARRQGAWVLKQ